MGSRTKGHPLLSKGNAITGYKLLDAVLIAFGENGFETTSVREIARGLPGQPQCNPATFRLKKKALGCSGRPRFWTRKRGFNSRG